MVLENAKTEVDRPRRFVIEDNIIKGMEMKIDSNFDNIGLLILKVFNDNANDVGQIDVETGRKITYGEMRENSIRCALWLQKQRIQCGDVIAICTHNQIDAYIPCIAAMLVGAIYNPWHHEVPLKTARHLMNLTRPKIMFSCEGSVNILKEAAKLEKVGTRIVVFTKYPTMECLKDTMRLQTNEDVRSFQVPEIKNSEGVAMILFSSGTTGMPKGVAHSHRTLFKNVLSFKLLLPKSISLWYSSLYWISGTFCMLQTMLTGGTRILHTNFHPEETCKIIDEFQVSWFFMTPTIIARLCKENIFDKYKLESLRNIITGGSKLSLEVLEKLRNGLPNVDFAQAFGMTELGGVGTVQTKQCKSIESVGFVVPNMQVKIIDVTTKKALGPNQPGELCLRSPTMMLGYHKNPTATKDTIDDEGWLHTGDKAYYDDDGEIFILDRLKEVMKFQGHQISPSEIEQILMTHSGVLEAAVVAVPHDTDIEQPMGFIRKIPGSKVTEDELIELSAQLGDLMRLRGGVKFLDEMPYTASGKICRKELREMAKAYKK